MRKSIKTAVILAAAAVTAVGAAGCGAGNENNIGKDAALEVALEDAGVSESDTTRLKVSEDRDDGRTIFEIQFDADGREYDYEVQASDGKILSADVELLTNGVQNTAGSGTQDGTADTQNNTDAQGRQNSNGSNNTTGTDNANAGTGSNNNQTADTAISLEEAAAIALERVPGATDSDIRIELDSDDGVYKYEGDIIYEQKEYDFEIDANTGTILEWSEERV